MIPLPLALLELQRQLNRLNSLIDEVRRQTPVVKACCAKHRDGWVCTLAPHDGPHEARVEGGDKVLARWSMGRLVGRTLVADPAGDILIEYPILVGTIRSLDRNTDLVAAAAELRPMGLHREVWRRLAQQGLDDFAYQRKVRSVTPRPQAVSVRSWFRKMRAADFDRDVYRTAIQFSINGVRQEMPWTLFDTQKVVERETKHVYPYRRADGRGLLAWVPELPTIFRDCGCPDCTAWRKARNARAHLNYGESD